MNADTPGNKGPMMGLRVAKLAAEEAWVMGSTLGVTLGGSPEERERA
jgi:hypothetical protein